MSINPDDRPWPRQVAHEDADWPTEDQRVLIPFREQVNAVEAGSLAAGITVGVDGKLYVLQAVEDDSLDPEAIHKESRLMRDLSESFDVPTIQHETHDRRGAIADFVRQHDITTTVLDQAEKFGGPTDRHPDCHTVVGTGLEHFESPSSILVPVAKGPHSGLAVKIAAALARAHDAWLELLHVVPADASDSVESDVRGLLDSYSHRVDGASADCLVEHNNDVTGAIAKQASYHDLTVLGAPQKGRLRRWLFGSTTDTVCEDVQNGPVLTVERKGEGGYLSDWL